MSKETIISLLGIYLVILPFLGFPQSWKTVMFILIGASLAFLGYMLRQQRSKILPGEAPTYQEYKPSNE